MNQGNVHVRKLVGVLLFLVCGLSLLGCRVTGGGSGGGGNNGGGVTTTFQKPAGLQIPAPGGTTNLATEILIGKFNDDAYPDLVVLSATTNYVYMSDRGRAWTRSILATGAQSFATGVVGDFISGGASIADLLLFRDGVNVQVFQSDGAGNFTPSFTTSGFTNLTAGNLALAPGSGSAGLTFDLIFISSITDGTTSSYVSYNSSTGQFGAPTALAAAPGSMNARAFAADFDGDSLVDVAHFPSQASTTFAVFRNLSGTAFASGTNILKSTNSNVRGGVASNLTGSSLPDIVLLTASGLELYENTTPQAGAQFSFSSRGLLADTFGRSLVIADLTGDELKDLLVAGTDGETKLFSQSSGLAFSDITSTAFSSLLSGDALQVYTADIDQDGSPDVLELSPSGDVSVYINNLSED